MQNIIEKYRELAKTKQKTIVFPEGNEERVIRAAEFVKKRNIIEPILIGNPDRINTHAKELAINIKNITIVNPVTTERINDWIEQYYELRKHKGLTKEQAKETLENPLFVGAFLLRDGIAAGAVAGSINATADVIRAGIHVVGLAPDVSVVSSSFIMVMKNNKVFTYADCGVIPDPTADQLVSIAISSAQTHSKINQEEPVIAMLSFSTKGSANHPSVDKVAAATKILKEQYPDLKADGELQFDAAYCEEIGKKKAPGSPVVGKANVFIFPNLDAGNICYKVTQRLAEADAFGPLIQGLKKPYMDLSRGCSYQDIINVACLCAILA
jgi:phosphate acetyltransferase